MMPPNPHRPGSPESIKRELADLRTLAQGHMDAAKFYLAGLVHETRMELGQPSRRQELVREMSRATAQLGAAINPHPLPVTCAACPDGIHHDDGLMCPRHEGALTHHYCDNGCPDCGRLRKDAAA